MKSIVYADNAATTKLDKNAYDVMQQYLLDQYANASQPYSFSREAKKAIKNAREIIAACINAEPDEIFFTSGGTESDNWALKGTMFVKDDNRLLITSQIEHHAILNSAASIVRMGYPVIYLPVDNTGIVSPAVLEKEIKANRTKLVSIMFSNNEIGTIEPIKELAEIAHSNGALFHTDAVQAIGHTSIDVKELDVDMLSAAAHKFNGPKGIGFLYIKKGTKISPLNDGGAQEFGLRAGTENVASIMAMAVALEGNCKAIAEHEEHLLKLEGALISKLNDASVDYVRNGAKVHIPGNVSLSFKGYSGEAILHRLDLMGICVSTGSACDSENTQISHVLAAINLDKSYAEGTIRISFGKDNTVAEAEMIAEALLKIVG